MERFLQAQSSLFRMAASHWHASAIVLTAVISSQGCGTIADTPRRGWTPTGAPPSESQPTDLSSDKPPAPAVRRETPPIAKVPSPLDTEPAPPVAKIPPAEPPTTETGLASWYGAKHHGKRTASGEVFNQNQFTAAHRTLPFGSRVKVINLDNGKSIYVRINDRGPFKRGRIIDVSRAAAKALDMVQEGIATVRIEWASGYDKTDDLALQGK